METIKSDIPLPHPKPPYLTDIVPSDYHLFRSMAHSLDEKQFHTYEDEKKNGSTRG